MTSMSAAPQRSPGLSVVLPAHNSTEFIRDALNSLTRQNLGRHELQVVAIDDASTDDTLSILESYHDVLNLTIIPVPENRGVSHARRRGLAEATGEYITFLDADDWLAPGYYAKVLRAIRRLDVDFIRTDYVQVHKDKRTLKRAPCSLRDVPLDPLDYIMPVDSPTLVDYPNLWTLFFHRKLYDEGNLLLDDSLRTCEDRVIVWNMHLHLASCAVINEYGLCYRKGHSAGSLTAVLDDRQLDFFPAFKHIFADVDAHPARDRIYPQALRTFFALLTHHIMKRGTMLPPELQVRLHQEAVTMTSTLDMSHKCAALHNFGEERLKVLEPILAGDASIPESLRREHG